MRSMILTFITLVTIWITFSGLQAQPVNDIDGNEYKTLTIGTQVWMAENLKATRYSDGMAIPDVTGPAEWAVLTSPSFCWYNNDAPAHKALYGALYNWYAVNPENNGNKNICPEGWHVPTDAEWKILISYLSGNGFGFESSPRDIAKSVAAASGWAEHAVAGNAGNDQATNNRSGFTALPAGYRNFLGTFNFVGSYAYWWSSTEFSPTNACYYFMHNYYSYVGKGNFRKENGFSVRCLRDQQQKQTK